MTVSMDGLRLHLLRSYNSLTRKLNRAIPPKDRFDSELCIDPEDIQEEMDDIRSCIVTLAYMYQEGEFEVLEDPHFEQFNEDEDED